MVDHGVRTHGSLATLANALAASRGHQDAAESVERALRRLRTREGEGGVWGTRLVHAVGLPDEAHKRLFWMGTYHSRFTDLPTAIGRALVRPWKRSVVTETPERVWIALAELSLTLREERDTAPALDAVQRCKPRGLALIESLLAEAYIASRPDEERSRALASRAGDLLVNLPPGHDQACLHARWIDHRGFWLNVRERRHAEALALYAQIPDDGPAFARVRRHSGMGWASVRLGDAKNAARHAHQAVEAAGDAGHLRLRVMALKLKAAVTHGAERARCLERALAIATLLEDQTLLTRLSRDRLTM